VNEEPGSRRGRICVTGLRELEAVGAVKCDHASIQRDPDGGSLLEGVRFLGDNPRKVSVNFDILGEATSFLVNAAAEGGCDFIADFYGNA